VEPGFNKLEKPAEYQYGGTGILVSNKLAHWAIGRRADKLGLEQWCWAKVHSWANQPALLNHNPCTDHVNQRDLPLYKQQV